MRGPSLVQPQSLEDVLAAMDAADEVAGLAVFTKSEAGRVLKGATKEKLVERLTVCGATHGKNRACPVCVVCRNARGRCAFLTTASRPARESVQTGTSNSLLPADINYSHTIFISYRSFTTTSELFRALAATFNRATTAAQRAR